MNKDKKNPFVMLTGNFWIQNKIFFVKAKSCLLCMVGYTDPTLCLCFNSSGLPHCVYRQSMHLWIPYLHISIYDSYHQGKSCKQIRKKIRQFLQIKSEEIFLYLPRQWSKDTVFLKMNIHCTSNFYCAVTVWTQDFFSKSY